VTEAKTKTGGAAQASESGLTESMEEILGSLATRFDASVLDGSEQNARIRAVVVNEGEWDIAIHGTELQIRRAIRGSVCDARLIADRATWLSIAQDARGGLAAYRAGRLIVRDNLHLGVAILAATSGFHDTRRVRFERVSTRSGTLSVARAGAGEPVLMIHGLGATKISFLPTVAALADQFEVIAVDLPGFGDSDKPLCARYDPPFFCGAVVELMDALGIERASIVGNSLGGRVAIELGLRHPDRVDRLVLLSPSLAWRQKRGWIPLVRLLRPELGLLQLVPNDAVGAAMRLMIPGARSGWAQAGVDEFLRMHSTRGGRLAFYSAVRNIYLEEPDGTNGFWTRLAGLDAPSLFIWGKNDRLVPVAFAQHVRHALPSAENIVIECGHVPQIEQPKTVEQEISRFLGKPALTRTR